MFCLVFACLLVVLAKFAGTNDKLDAMEISTGNPGILSRILEGTSILYYVVVHVSAFLSCICASRFVETEQPHQSTSSRNGCLLTSHPSPPQQLQRSKHPRLKIMSSKWRQQVTKHTVPLMRR